MHNTDSIEFGRKLARLRKARNMTKTQLANAINASVSTITNYETGYTTPNYSKIEKISEALGVDITTNNDMNLKINQKAFTNCTILLYRLDNIEGLLTLNPSTADFQFNIPMEYTYPSYNIFATVIEDNSMTKSYINPGELAFFQSDIMPENNTIVLAYIKSENKMVIRYYTFEDGIVILTDNSYYSKPVHTQYYSDDIQIIGSLVKRTISGNH